MKPIKIDLSSELDSIELHPIADLHIGESNCNMGKIKNRIQRIAETPNAYVLLAGDLINNAVKTSISDTYSETMSPMDQLQTVCTLLNPIADRVLCACPGNHCERTYRQDGIDIMRLISRELGFENRYRPDFAYLFISFGLKSRRAAEGRKQSYTVYVNHGSGGGRKIGGKANRLNDLSMICDADIFCIGHTHTPIVFKDSFIRSVGCSSGIELVERVYVNTSAALDYGGYSARQSYQPVSTSAPVIVLSGTERKIDVRL